MTKSEYKQRHLKVVDLESYCDYLKGEFAECLNFIVQFATFVALKNGTMFVQNVKHISSGENMT